MAGDMKGRSDCDLDIISMQCDNEARYRKQITITRPIFTEETFQEGYRISTSDSSATAKLRRSCTSNLSISGHGLCLAVLKFFPIIGWLKEYNWRKDIIGDVISGLTTAVMRIPQEMAYALLATVPAVYGLYSAFFPVILYAVLGTSKHISIGTWAVVSIMIGNAIDAVIDVELSNINNGTSEMAEMTSGISAEDNTMLRVQIATSLCLLVGIIQTLMGVLRLGFVTNYLSEPLVRGFTTGAAVHVFTSQFPKLLGIKTTRRTGVITLVYTYIELFTKLKQTNPCAVIMSVLALMMLILIAEMNDLQAHKSWCRREGRKGKKLPIPSELFVVICATLASFLGRFESRYNLSVVGDIPTGVPVPTVPSLRGSMSLFGSAFAMAIVGFAISISMAQLFAKKHEYEVEANQELIAYGSCHIFGSFFRCFPHATSMSRTAVQEGSGGKTQLAGIISALVVVVILLRLGPLFSQLPQCILGAIIVVALRGILRQIKDLPLLWKVNNVDFAIWLLTFLCVCLLGVDLGLLCGVGIALVTIVLRTQIPNSSIIGAIPNTDIYRDVARVPDAREIPGIKIFCFSSSLCFINADNFKNSLFQKVGINPQKLLIAKHKGDINKKLEYSHCDEEPRNNVHQVQTIIIDCCMFNYIDTVGVKTLQTLITDYDKVDIRVVLANCKETVRQSLLKSATLNKKEAIGLDRMYLTLHDAVADHMPSQKDDNFKHVEVKIQNEISYETGV
ncbi:prestin-like isoform X2 [Amphiura filiformis]